MVNFSTIVFATFGLFAAEIQTIESTKICNVHTCTTWESSCENYGKVLKDNIDPQVIHCKGDACIKKCCMEKECDDDDTCASWDGECEKFDLIDRDDIDFDLTKCKGDKQCKKKCCEKPKTEECQTCATADINCEEIPGLVNKSGVVDIKCETEEDCIRECCKSEEPTCAIWNGKCKPNQTPKPNPEDIECVNNKNCHKVCCEDKPTPPTCAVWAGKCKPNQTPKPNPEDIECKGKHCKKVCCEDKPKPPTCAIWTGKCKPNQTPKPNPEDIECVNNKNCHKVCCEEKPKPPTCAEWKGKCKPNQIPKPTPEDIECVNNKNCHKVCCEEKPKPPTCAEWKGNCKPNQIPKPTPEDIECKGKHCQKVCCEEKPKLPTCSDWKGNCAAGLRPKPNAGNVECKGQQCASVCCEDIPTCSDWKGQCGAGLRPKPSVGNVECKGQQCESVCCEDIPTCSDWKGKCAAGLRPKPSVGNVECKGQQCASVCCENIPTCSDWKGKCAAGLRPKPSVGNVECKGQQCASVCCEDIPTCSDWKGECGAGLRPKPSVGNVECKGQQCENVCCEKIPKKKCPDYHFKVNGNTPGGTITLAGPQKLIISTSLEAHVKISVDNDYIQSNQCAFTTGPGVNGELWVSITPHKVTSGHVHFDFTDESGANCRHSQRVVNGVSRAHGKIWGDPHTETLDGAKHSYSKGSYGTVFKAYDFLIKAHFHHGINNLHPLSTMNHLSIQYKNTFIELYSPHNYDFNKYNQRLHASFSGSKPEQICWNSRHINNQRHHYDLAFPCGSRLWLSVVYGGAYWGWFIQVEDFYPSPIYKGHVEMGLFGNWDGNRYNDYDESKFVAFNTNFERGLPSNKLPVGLETKVCKVGRPTSTPNDYCRSIHPTYSPLGINTKRGRREVGKKSKHKKMHMTKLKLANESKHSKKELVNAKSAAEKLDKNIACSVIKTSQWGKLAVSSGCITASDLDEKINGCVTDSQQGDAQAAIHFTELLVSDCIRKAELFNKQHTNEFYKFAKKNKFDSCNYPVGGEPSENGCQCYDGFTGDGCD
eukprot:Pgem_evm1s5264